MDTRRQWVTNLSTEQQAALATQEKNFEQQYKPQEQEQMRGVARELGDAQADDSTAKTLLAFGLWLAELNPGDVEQLRNELRDLPPAEQADRVASVVRRQRERESRHFEILPSQLATASDLTASTLLWMPQRLNALVCTFAGNSSSRSGTESSSGVVAQLFAISASLARSKW